MDPGSFGDDSPGHLVPISGARGISHAFVPEELPPEWEWPTELWPLLMAAREGLAGLDGTGKHLPNPDLVLRPLQAREAQKSSNLEGTYTNPEEQAIFDLDPESAPGATGERVDARREVFNYSQALRLRRERELPLSLRLIREFHRVLMTGVRGAERSPGEFRRTQNQIGRPPHFVPPPLTELDRLLSNFEKYLHTDNGLDPLVRAFVAHYQIETIHPFMDGNGRVGRLFLAVCIAEWNGLDNQWLYMSDYFDQHRDEYMARLFEVSSRGAWLPWIRFCLEGVVEQARDSQQRYDRLILMHRTFHEVVHDHGGSARLTRLVDQLFLNPMIRVTDARDLLDVTYPTASSDLEKLQELQIVRRLEDIAPITYFCPSIWRVIHED